MDTDVTNRLNYVRARDILCLVIASGHGLRDSELKTLLAMSHPDGALTDHNLLAEHQLTAAEWAIVRFWTKPFVRIISDKFGKRRTRFVYRNYTTEKVVTSFYAVEAPRVAIIPTPHEEYYHRILAAYFSLCREEYPFQLLKLANKNFIAKFFKTEDFRFEEMIDKYL